VVDIWRLPWRGSVCRIWMEKSRIIILHRVSSGPRIFERRRHQVKRTPANADFVSSGLSRAVRSTYPSPSSKPS
jgi:hypothetical protein